MRPTGLPIITTDTFLNEEDFKIFGDVFLQLPLPMVVVGTDEKIAFINHAYAMYLKEEQKNMVGRPITDFVPNSRVPFVLKSKQAEIFNYHRYVGGTLDGEETIVHLIPIMDKKNNIKGCFGMLLFQNIDDLMELTIKNKTLRDELEFYKKELKYLQNTKYTLDNILGSSKAVKDMKEEIIRFAPGNSTILIHGESGSGKELVAHSIHNASKRSMYPFLRLNCAAIPENLFESEFFGYEAGAFTGAAKGGKKGKFELANHGTLFLDEIGELPLFMQAKLLRVLQEKEFTRVGGDKEISVDVRIIAATNRSLEDMVREGKFREDLYFRLNILNIDVPPLRDRTEDLKELVSYCLEKLYNENGVLKVIDTQALEILKKYSWKGNIRELNNVIEKMYFTADKTTIDISHIPPNIMSDVVSNDIDVSTGEGLDTMLEELENRTVELVLKETDNNISKTAKILNISRPRLYRIMKRLNK